MRTALAERAPAAVLADLAVEAARTAAASCTDPEPEIRRIAGLLFMAGAECALNEIERLRSGRAGSTHAIPSRHSREGTSVVP